MTPLDDHKLYTIPANMTFVLCLNLLAKDYDIPKSKLRLDTIIGQGQFGDVHRGTYVSPVSSALPYELRMVPTLIQRYFCVVCEYAGK